MLIHGLTSTPWEVRPVGVALREAGFHAESFWLPGHGTRPEDLRGVRWQDWVQSVEARYDAMLAEHGRVAVLGTSLGGSLALWLGITRQPTALVSMGGAVWLPWPSMLARAMSYLRPFQNKRPEGSAIRDPAARARHPSYRKTSFRAIAEMRALLAQIKPRLAEIDSPLLVMHGRLDRVIPPGNAEYILMNVSSARKKLLWFEESDHIITEDYEHAQVAAAAVSWIAERAEG